MIDFGRGLGAVGAVMLLVGAGCGGGKVPTLPEKVVGHCDYKNRFSKGAECRDYHGEWSPEGAEDDCRGWEGQFTLGERCDVGEVLGYCVLTSGSERFIRVSLPGQDSDGCGPSERGCELFGGGVFDPAPVCGGKVSAGGGTGLPTFQPPRRVCTEPRPSEPAGKSEEGKVCTWEMISGATEEGRSFSDYASCDRVRTQRPYYPVKPAPEFDRADPRLDDAAYRTEQAWVRQQIEATACVCCHSTRSPEGPSNWYLEAPGNFLNSFNPRGLAMGAGWIDTVGFGAFAKEDNNGFSRAAPDRPEDSIFVTTDPARMKRFFEAELAHRGFSRADFEGQPYGGGPLDDQRFFRPKECTGGEGITGEGQVNWRGGAARYVYVLEAQAASPTVPPNLDLPEGTLWRLDVPPEGTPVATGTVRYGVVPEGASQRFPEKGAPRPLVSGQTYYLYVTADVIIPITRCLFTAP